MGGMHNERIPSRIPALRICAAILIEFLGQITIKWDQITQKHENAAPLSLNYKVKVLFFLSNTYLYFKKLNFSYYEIYFYFHLDLLVLLHETHKFDFWNKFFTLKTYG